MLRNRIDFELRDAVKYLEEIVYEDDQQFIAQINKLIDIDVDIYNEGEYFEIYDEEQDGSIFLKITPSKLTETDNLVEIINMKGDK